MAANLELAKRQGLSEETMQEINNLHAIIDSLMKPPYTDKELTYKTIEKTEYKLQELWGFDQNEYFHTHKHKYKFLSSVVGRKFKNTDTGEIITIPEDIRRGGLVSFSGGEKFIDVGDGHYTRIVGSGIVEVTDDAHRS